MNSPHCHKCHCHLCSSNIVWCNPSSRLALSLHHEALLLDQLVVCILELFYSTLKLLSILSWGRRGKSLRRWGRPHAKSLYIARSRLKNHHRYLFFSQRLCFRSAAMLILYSQHLLLSFQKIETIRSTYVLVLQTYIELKYIYSSFANSRHVQIYIHMLFTIRVYPLFCLWIEVSIIVELCQLRNMTSIFPSLIICFSMLEDKLINYKK